MLLGRVVGTVVATRKEPTLDGLKFLVLKQLDIEGRETGGYRVAADAIGAGLGDHRSSLSCLNASLRRVHVDLRPVYARLGLGQLHLGGIHSSLGCVCIGFRCIYPCFGLGHLRLGSIHPGLGRIHIGFRRFHACLGLGQLRLGSIHPSLGHVHFLGTSAGFDFV